MWRSITWRPSHGRLELPLHQFPKVKLFVLLSFCFFASWVPLFPLGNPAAEPEGDDLLRAKTLKLDGTEVPSPVPSPTPVKDVGVKQEPIAVPDTPEPEIPAGQPDPCSPTMTSLLLDEGRLTREMQGGLKKELQNQRGREGPVGDFNSQEVEPPTSEDEGPKKRPAGKAKAKAKAKAAVKSKAKSKAKSQPKRKGKKDKDGEEPATPKSSKKAVATSPEKATSPKLKRPAAKRKSKATDGKDESKTKKVKVAKEKGGENASFARRYPPQDPVKARWWKALRDSFNANIKPGIFRPSHLEDFLFLLVSWSGCQHTYVLTTI